MAGGGGGGLQSEINVTPMVDIMLVLLIIFMVVTPFLQQGITVVYPKNMENPDVDQNIIKENSIVISIPNDGEYYLGKQKILIETPRIRIKTRIRPFVTRLRRFWSRSKMNRTGKLSISRVALMCVMKQWLTSSTK